jgi:hypothetical protein
VDSAYGLGLAEIRLSLVESAVAHYSFEAGCHRMAKCLDRLRLVVLTATRRFQSADSLPEGEGTDRCQTVHWLPTPLTRILMPYRLPIAVMNSVCRSFAPKHTLAVQFSGTAMCSICRPVLSNTVTPRPVR